METINCCSVIKPPPPTPSFPFSIQTKRSSVEGYFITVYYKVQLKRMSYIYFAQSSLFLTTKPLIASNLPISHH